jgi:hypothetical protein
MSSGKSEEEKVAPLSNSRRSERKYRTELACCPPEAVEKDLDEEKKNKTYYDAK